MDDPNMHAYGEAGPDDAEIGRQWRENSSLEKWFPLTAERLAALEAENEALKRPLTDEEMFTAMKSVSALGTAPWGWREIGRAVEAAHLKAAQAAKERT